MVWDVITYNGEKEILEIRLNILDKFVDRFIIVEANQTFSGNQKPLYFSQNEQQFREWWPKIDYYIVNKWDDEKLWAMAKSSPNTIGAAHWKQEFYIKESIHKALHSSDVQDDDLVYIGDVDEIWSPHYPGHPAKLKLLVYAYYLNNLSNEEFWGTLVAKYRDIKGECLNHLRSNITLRTPDYHGWHFTSMGGVKEVSRKLNDSYTPESYNTFHVQQMLPERVQNGTDYLGRSFVFETETRKWPQFLKENRLNYNHLCKI